jgi:hypothetical protein
MCFASTLSIYTPYITGIGGLIAGIVSHEKAKIMFEPCLTATELKRFNAAWDAYVNCRISYDPDGTNTQSETAQYFLDHLENLLKYATLK